MDFHGRQIGHAEIVRPMVQFPVIIGPVERQALHPAKQSAQDHPIISPAIAPELRFAFIADEFYQ